jgi:large subunit ribosomal protein L10
MNREQKSATIEALAAEIDGAGAVFAVDYRGISVSQAAELRAKLRDADATFRVVKNSLTERAADQVGAETLKTLLTGPTALTFVRGDAAMAAKAIADQARATQLLPFKGGLMDGDVLDAEQIRAISRLPSREALYGQLVGMVASPISGLVRTLGGLVGGLAVALSQVREKKESGEIPSGESPVAEAASPEPEPELDPSEAAPSEAASPEAASPEPEPAAADSSEVASDGEPAAVEPAGVASEGEPAAVEPAGAVSDGEPAAVEPAEVAPEASTQDQAEPASEPAQDDNNTDASAQEQPESAEATKED